MSNDVNTDPNDLQQRCINAIRVLSMDAVERANSGHPGAPMGAAPMAYTLWTKHLKHNPENPDWADRDRFVLSAGHASMLLYSLLHLTGYDLSIDEIKNFRQWGSKTPGHPEYGLTPGVEVTTGPLGSGFAAGVGMAISEKMLAQRFNSGEYKVVDHYTYAIVSDGDLMEGVASEAASLAGTLGLGKLIYLYDSNDISIEGSTDLAFREDVNARFLAYGWHVIRVDGSDPMAVDKAINQAKTELRRPSLIIATTVIAEGSPNKSGTAGAHGSPLGYEEAELTKKALGWTEKPFTIPQDVLQKFRLALDKGRLAESSWDEEVEKFSKISPSDLQIFKNWQANIFPDDWKNQLPQFSPDDGVMATRAASGKVLNSLAQVIGNLVGGSADLAPSNNTELKGFGDFEEDSWSGRNIHFGVREHAMGGIVNGMALHGGIRPYSATFLVFADYMRPPLRLGAIMSLPVIYIFTHDSIAVGEDGPTHQPVEQLAALRAIPGLTVIRPADGNETASAWAVALEQSSPSVLILTRQGLPQITSPEVAKNGVSRGGYILSDSEKDTFDVSLIASGSEVSLVVAAGELLESKGVISRIVSMPSWELFEEQSEAYRNQVLPPDFPAKLAVEAGIGQGWEKFIGGDGEMHVINNFGASAPGKVVMEKFGFTAEEVASHAQRLIKKLRSR